MVQDIGASKKSRQILATLKKYQNYPSPQGRNVPFYEKCDGTKELSVPARTEPALAMTVSISLANYPSPQGRNPYSSS